MIDNQLELETQIKLKRAITEKTRPDTVSNQPNNPIGYNNLNSVLRNVDEGRCVQYIDVPRMETAKINANNMVKDITPKDEEREEKEERDEKEENQEEKQERVENQEKQEREERE